MAKLYFRYGTMDSAKSLNLLADAHNYRKQGKKVLLVKPRLDVRFGAGTIASRSGLAAEADLLVDDDTELRADDFRSIEEVKVTCQFCQKKATFNLRLADGRAVSDGPQVELGADDRYAPVCWQHYDARVNAG